MKNLKNIRLNNYDYSQNGYYFVTICSNFNKPGLNNYLNLIEDSFSNLNEIKGVSVERKVIMSNHLHVIIVLENCKFTLGEIIRRFKAQSSKNAGTKLWQANYYEHVIRDDEALDKIREYIINNPEKEKVKFEEFYDNTSIKQQSIKDERRR